jgi:hypothetical protein
MPTAGECGLGKLLEDATVPYLEYMSAWLRILLHIFGRTNKLLSESM